MSPISRSKENFILLLVGIAGLISFIYSYPRVQTAAQLELNINRKEALEVTRAYLQESVSPGSISPYSKVSIAFEADNRLYSFFKYTGATPQERKHLTIHSAPHFWNVTFENPVDRSRYRFRISTEGQLIHIQYRAPEDLQGERLTPRMAESIARNQLKGALNIDWREYSRVDFQSADQETRIDHTFSWHTITPVVGEARLRIDATIMGDQLKGWSKSIEYPRDFEDSFNSRQTSYNLSEVSRIIVSLLFWLIALFVFAFRFRSDEVGLQNGLVMALLLLGALVFYWADSFDYIEQFGPETGTEIGRIIKYVNVGLQVFFTSFGIFFVWTAGESLGRDLWPQKLKTIDGILARRFFFPDLGRAILRGTSLGLTQLGIWYVGALLIAKHVTVWPIISTLELQILSASSANVLFLPITPLFFAISAALSTVAYAFLFSLGFFGRATKNTFIAVLISWLVFSSLNLNMGILLPIWVSIILGLIAGLLSYVFFLRYDALTVLIGTFLGTYIPGILLYLHQPNPTYFITGIVGLLVLSSLFVFGILARVRGKELNDRAIEPAYVRNISERQRMRLELDVARQAQLQMLPQSIPSRQGLDIAAFSEPAKEVGGDYFDFFEVDDHNLGFAVGDVSGKGISAALYMTMLKGSLQSQAMNQSSPKDLLSHINRTFFKSADKTTYVTLLYGVINLHQKTLTFARAGHNPILIFRPQDQTLFFLKPPGLGIGLEKGDIFERILTEEAFNLIEGDTIIIYTDGLTEARNIKDEEFGEDRLTEIVKSRPIQSAEELLQRIKNGYFTFTGRAEPHDDLTCMIIRLQ